MAYTAAVAAAAAATAIGMAIVIGIVVVHGMLPVPSCGRGGTVDEAGYGVCAVFGLKNCKMPTADGTVAGVAVTGGSAIVVAAEAAVGVAAVDIC